MASSTQVRCQHGHVPCVFMQEVEKHVNISMLDFREVGISYMIVHRIVVQDKKRKWLKEEKMIINIMEGIRKGRRIIIHHHSRFRFMYRKCLWSFRDVCNSRWQKPRPALLMLVLGIVLCNHLCISLKISSMIKSNNRFLTRIYIYIYNKILCRSRCVIKNKNVTQDQSMGFMGMNLFDLHSTIDVWFPFGFGDQLNLEQLI